MRPTNRVNRLQAYSRPALITHHKRDHAAFANLFLIATAKGSFCMRHYEGGTDSSKLKQTMRLKKRLDPVSG